MASVNQRLLDAAIAHLIALHRYGNKVVRDIQAVLRSADNDLFSQLNVVLSRAAEESFSVRRLDELMVGVSALNDRVYAQAQQKLATELKDLSEYELGHQKALFDHLTPSAVRVTTPSVGQAYAAATAKPFQGHLMESWFSDLPKQRQRRLMGAVRMGFVEGKTVDEMVREVRGTKAQGYKDGILEIDRRNAEAVVRTAVSQTAAVAREEFYDANSDLIEAEQWVSTLDNRTTELCMVRDGLKYTCKDHEPIKHKVPWLQGPGAIHWNCRSTSIPIIKSAEALGLDLPPLERAAMNGTAAADTKYADWIARQSAKMQDDILGPTRGALMRQGKLPFDRFFNNRGDFLTLDELRERDFAAFRRADL